MKFRALAVFPLVCAALMAAVALAMGDRMSVALTAANEGGKVLALIGAVTAAMAFDEGDYLKRAWLTFSTCYVFLLINDGLGCFGAATPTSVVIGGVLVTVANVGQVAGIWMLARAWSVAGLGDDGLTRRRIMFAGAAVLSVLITGWPLIQDTRTLLGGNASALVNIASDLGDTFTLALIAPVMHTALAMRGGLLRWPWSLLTASCLAWLAYDLSSGAVLFLHIGNGPMLVASESMRMLATGWVFAAGVSQRFALAPDAAVDSY